ncbi:UDP-glucose 4-epimerase GalE [Mycoplasmoides pirum]|uniref:UDP-glucose 4-epimerase GalE n=1 Tax=Mycoplasmoides pirum TaxID=2122 RepID=UPI00048598FA|nr:UDP-glucose 4-epimerase GalE [Mycoplasmoides pirum]
MKYLLIGGAGYIGSNVAHLLAQNKKNQILVFDDLSTGTKKALPKSVKFMQGSQLDYKKLTLAVKKIKPDVIMHFAAKIIVSESVSKPLEYYKNNVGGLINILEVMKENKIKKIIFSSTAAVYGNPEKLPIFEDDVKNPINPYGSSKLTCEFLLKAAEHAYGIKSVILRYFNVAGASDDYKLGIFNKKTTLLIPRLVMSYLNNNEFKIFGNDYKDTKDGTCLRDFIHVVDLANAHLLAVNYLNDIKNKTIAVNLGSNKGYTVKECLTMLEKITKSPLKNVKICPRRQGDPSKLITSNILAKKFLKWIPQKTLKDMIQSDLMFRTKNKIF